ncbi:hypothetical protein AWRI1631_162590, partial [Saccharomyces cerevisiae AWRI1631]
MSFSRLSCSKLLFFVLSFESPPFSNPLTSLLSSSSCCCS